MSHKKVIRKRGNNLNRFRIRPLGVVPYNNDRKQEHDEVMLAIGQPVEGDGQEHGEIIREIMGHGVED